MPQCQYCKKQHDGSYASGRFCGFQCSLKSRRKNRLKTINKQKKLGVYKKNFKPNVSQLQKGVSRVLSKHGIIHQVQYRVGKYYFDIKIGNVLLEINGDFWHANPQQYKANTIINFPGHKKKYAGQVWRKDLQKKICAVKKGYKVIYVWESEVHKLTQGILVSTIIKRIKGELIQEEINNDKDI